MVSKTKIFIVVAVTFLLIIISGCKEDTDLIKCNSDLLTCSGSLNMTKSDYTTCSSNFKSCSDSLGACNQDNAKLQDNYNALTVQYNETLNKLNNCTNEKVALALEIKKSDTGRILGIILEIILSIGLFCVTKSIEDAKLKKIVWFALGTIILLSVVLYIWWFL